MNENIRLECLRLAMGLGGLRVDAEATVEHARRFAEFVIGPEPEFPSSADEPIDFSNLSVRASNTLKNIGATRYGDICRIGEVELLRTPNVGEGTVTEIRRALAEKGLLLPL